jgi:hypothetical protein
LCLGSFFLPLSFCLSSAHAPHRKAHITVYDRLPEGQGILSNKAKSRLRVLNLHHCLEELTDRNGSAGQQQQPTYIISLEIAVFQSWDRRQDFVFDLVHLQIDFP